MPALPILLVALTSAIGPGRTPIASIFAGLILGVTMLPQAVLSPLLPLAKEAYRATGGHSLLLLLSIVAGATMTPALVPPARGDSAPRHGPFSPRLLRCRPLRRW